MPLFYKRVKKKNITRSIVGYPKDIIGIKYIGKAQVFGDEALTNRSALTLYHPLEDGVVREASEKDYNAALELLKFVITEDKDLLEIKEIIRAVKIPSDRVYLMPQGLSREEQLKNQESVAQLCFLEGFNFSPRVHVLTYDTRRKI